MKESFGQRLKLARTSAGMSQDQLVKAINMLVSKNAISKYEKGLMMPDSKVLIAIANALKVKTDFFFRKNQVDLPEVKFRKASKLKASDINKLKGKSTDLLERYLEIEKLLDVQTGFKNPVAKLSCSRLSDISAIAQHIRKTWKLGLNPIPNVIEMLECHGVKVVEFEAPEEFNGLSTWVGDVPLIVLNQNVDNLRKRFTALHELGHLVLKIDRESISHKQEERLCNAFANELLIPTEKFIEKIGAHRHRISINELIDLKEYYGISIAALVFKIQELGIVSANQTRHFWQQRNQNPELKYEQGSKYGNYEGKEESDRFMQLIYRAAAEEIISLSKAASLANIKLASFRDQYLSL